MKPLDFTKPITTRDGRKVRILCTDGPELWPVAGYIEGGSAPESWHSNGEYLGGEIVNRNDLINPPTKRKVEFWVNVYEGGMISDPYDTQNEANSGKSTVQTRIACLHFTREYEEGEGL